MKVLMHSCCGPCSTYPIKVLKEKNIEITSMWFNPNIHPYMEYKNRYEAWKKLMEIESIPTIEIDKYGLLEFTRAVHNKEYDRCGYCYESRFDVIARTAKENGFDNNALMELCRKYEEDAAFATITNIVVFGYSFSYTELQALQDNVKKFSVTRNSRINVEIRY